MKTKIYLAGPMTGYNNYNYDAFFAAEKELERSFIVFNPARNPTQSSYAEYIKKGIEMLVQCDAIYLLKGWEKSTGACLERHIAQVLGIFVYREWEKETGEEDCSCNEGCEFKKGAPCFYYRIGPCPTEFPKEEASQK